MLKSGTRPGIISKKVFFANYFSLNFIYFSYFRWKADFSVSKSESNWKKRPNKNKCCWNWISRARQCAGSTHLHTERAASQFKLVYGLWYSQFISGHTSGLFFIHKSFIYRRETARKYANWLRNGKWVITFGATFGTLRWTVGFGFALVGFLLNEI